MRSAGATVKAEADDIAGVPGGYAARDRVRRLAEHMFRSGGGNAEDSQSSSDN